MGSNRTSLLPAAVALLFARLLMEISFTALGTAIAWGYPELSWRPMAGIALGILAAAAAFRFLSGGWRGAGRAVHQAAAVASIVLVFIFLALLVLGDPAPFGLPSIAVPIAAAAAAVSWFRASKRRAAGGRAGDG